MCQSDQLTIIIIFVVTQDRVTIVDLESKAMTRVIDQNHILKPPSFKDS